MATYTTTLLVPVGIDATFAYVSDFRHATWDPRVSEARRTDGDGPIGVGSTFELLSPAPLGTIVFRYRVERYEPPARVTLSGSTWFARYTDDISFVSEGDGTRLTYDARFDVRGLLCLGSPIMSVLFRRIGDDATRGIPAAVVAGTKAK